MNKLWSSKRQLVNSLGFSALYFFSSSLGGFLLFAWVMGISHLYNILSRIFLGNPLRFNTDFTDVTLVQIFFQSILYVVGVPVCLYLATKVFEKVKSVILFMVFTFFASLIAEYYSYTAFFTQQHHLSNPFFYTLVFLYLGTKTLMLSYLWKLFIRDDSKSSLPVKTYVISIFILVTLFVPVYLAVFEGTYVRWGGYFFRNYLVNIFFLDQSGYFLLTFSLYVLTVISIVAKTLSILMIYKKK